MHENDAPNLHPAVSTLIYLSLSFRRQRFKIESAHLKELRTDFGDGGRSLPSLLEAWKSI
jgi:hypothetical protein